MARAVAYTSVVIVSWPRTQLLLGHEEETCVKRKTEAVPHRGPPSSRRRGGCGGDSQGAESETAVLGVGTGQFLQ